ncbi:hypothetical protein ACWPM1_11890 [Tsuneonella sp. HG249]
MLKALLCSAVLVASVAGPALAQAPATPPPPLPGSDDLSGSRGMGEMNRVPGESADPRTAAEDALARRNSGQSRAGTNTSQADLARAYLGALEAYVERTGGRRADALEQAAAQPDGPPQAANQIRNSLAKDLAEWSKAFGFDEATQKDQRGQWLTDAPEMSAADWTKRRAAWFAARDEWIAQQQAWATTQIRP